MKKYLTMFLSMVLLSTMLIACSQGAPETSGSSSENGGDEGESASNKYAFVFKNTGNPYGEKMMEGFQEVIEELGGEVILRSPDQPTAEGQIQIIEQLITQKVAAIAVAGNDQDALEPVLKKAMDQGIKVLSVDSAVNANSRLLHVNQANPERIGRVQVEAVSEMIGGVGQIAILSATSQATNQNLWIEWMKKELEKPEYSKIELVKVAYGDDLRDKSVSEAEALLKSYPDLKGIIAPTTVGIAAAGKVLTDKGLQGKVALTGLGLPSEMASYIENDVSPWMYLWNPIDVGKVTGYAANALVEGTITGSIGDKLEAGDQGTLEIVEDGDGTQIMLGDPFKFDKDNIAEWKDVY
ncbi:rhamnose ABC transporter substrate-binding protein [Robertmurraya kyonggiensis]|uniref:Rhamnose ABC transporter substrate-binding protein n=1 Tax=Robertmurraya kyonggiensis TaxID=1037680 RepID=A0A4U1D9H0_9BACI|nr:rhamnose ABC transporter substrate-binding protein [Robertmurraya kyonggiensis]TKC19151.1 rhamnose ABC transporter substrate-binding protein [Robertmurraya kyonggiensis]